MHLGLGNGSDKLAVGPGMTSPHSITRRVLGIASDPGPSECLPFARRTLIGDSGQKTQGFLAKLGLTRSYVLVNAFAVATFALAPGCAQTLAPVFAALHACNAVAVPLKTNVPRTV